MQVDWGLLYRNVGIHPEEIRDLKRSSHMTLNLLPGYWQVQPEPEASLKDPTTPLSRATVVHQRDPAKRRKLHKRIELHKERASRWKHSRLAHRREGPPGRQTKPQRPPLAPAMNERGRR